MTRTTFIAGLVIAGLVAAGLAVSPGYASDAPAPKSDDSELLRRLLGDDPLLEPPPPRETGPPSGGEPEKEATPADGDAAPAADAQALARISERLKEAGRRLKEGQTGRPTQDAQQAVIDELGRLLEAAKNQQSKPRPSPGAESSGAQDSAPDGKPAPSETPAPAPEGADDRPDGPPRRNRDGKAEESSDRLPEEGPLAAPRDFRAEFVRDAWGHLPPRLREQLLNADSDKYLPQYDSLVRRYFESLAQPEPAPPGP